MAHKILGIDLGAYSVKVALLEAGFRQARLIAVHERPLLPREGDESDLARGTRTLHALVTDENLEREMCAAALGDEAAIRLVTVSFSDRKKIEQVLGFELEGQVMGDMGDLVHDFVIANTDPALGGETRVVAVVAPRVDVQARIAALQAVGCEPRLIGAPALSYAALIGHGIDGHKQAQIVVDIGHRRTHVCVIQHNAVVFARTIPRGGEEVTLAIEEGFRMTPEDAHRAKHEQAFLLAPGAVAESPSHRRVDQTLRDAVRPLVRDLKQTLAAHRMAGEAPVEILLTGGGSLLRGLPEHLAAELDLPVRPLCIPDRDPMLGPDIDEARRGPTLPAQALGLALAVAVSVPQINLRKGDLSYRGDFTYLRGKAVYLGVVVAVLLVFATINAVAARHALTKESEALEAQLKRVSTELFKEPRTNAKAIIDELRAGPKGGAPPIPTTTAFDLLGEISQHIPADVKVDVVDLDIRPKKTTMRGTAESAQQIDQLVTELQKIDCFKEVEKDKVSSVTAPPSGDNTKGDKPREVKQFTLTITTTCP